MRLNPVIVFLIVSIYISPIYGGNIRINEIVANNFNSIYDEDNETPDWIELYNGSNKAISIGGYRISDRNDYSKAWTIPDTAVKGYGFLLLHADGKNRITSDNYIIEASGYGINYDEKKDGFRFNYLAVTGDFDIAMRVNSITNKYYGGKTGLIARANLNEDSRFTGILVYQPQYPFYTIFRRDTAGNATKRMEFACREFPYNWVRLRREGDTIIYSIKQDGYHWKVLYSSYMKFNNSIYVGIASSGADCYNSINGRFSVSELCINNAPTRFDTLKSIAIPSSVTGSSSYSRFLHTNFSLDTKGETLYLWDKNGVLVDSMAFGRQKTNVSFGRYPDGANRQVYSENPTPERANHNGFMEIASLPGIDPVGGFYSDTVRTTITKPNDTSRVFYTTNGTDPCTSSHLYNGSGLSLPATTILRAGIFDDKKLPISFTTRTYFVNEPFNLPVISIVSDTNNLWPESTGILNDTNRWSEREIPVHFEYWDAKDSLSYSSDAGLKLHGQGSRNYPQRSFRLYSRTLYGNDEFNYPFWQNNGLPVSDKLVLKNAGQDWNFSYIRDGFCGVLGRFFPNVMNSAYKPVVAYINGKYWGLYHLRERFDDDYLSRKFGIDKDSVSIIENYTIEKGSSIDFFNKLDTVLCLDMVSDSAYNLASNCFDPENIIELTIFRTFVAAYDWPDNNNKIWNSPDFDQCWRWILYDLDISVGFNYANYDFNMYGHMDSFKCDFIQVFKKFLENSNFRIQYFNKYADCLNSVFKPEYTVPLLDSLAGEIRSEIPRQQKRWPGSVPNWEEEIGKMKTFLEIRPHVVWDHIVSNYGLDGTLTLQLETGIDGACTYQVNTINTDSSSWEGKYFKNIPFKVLCKPSPGFRFVRWEGAEAGKMYYTVNSASDTVRLKAVLVKDGNATKGRVAINEIMYKSSDERDCKDWIEIVNNSEEVVDLDSWTLKDDNDDHIFTIKKNIPLLPDSFLVISEDTDAFRTLYTDGCLLTGNLDFGFSKDDVVRLYNSEGVLMDSVDYSNKLPWDPEADGTGYSLELSDPSKDNSLPRNWSASVIEGGTPGMKNGGPESAIQLSSTDISLRCLPNPVTAIANIKFELPYDGRVSLDLINIFGNRMAGTETNSLFPAGSHSVPIDCSGLAPGSYFVRLFVSGNKPTTYILHLLKN